MRKLVSGFPSAAGFDERAGLKKNDPENEKMKRDETDLRSPQRARVREAPWGLGALPSESETVLCEDPNVLLLAFRK